MKIDKNVGMEVKKLSNLFKRNLFKIDIQNEIEGFTGLQGFIIRYLNNNNDKDIYQKDLEKILQMRRSSASSVLSLMEKNGLIERQSVEKDARLKKIVLTKKSISFNKEIEKRIKKVESKATKGLSNEELIIFFNIVSKIENNLKEDIDDIKVI